MGAGRVGVGVLGLLCSSLFACAEGGECIDWQAPTQLEVDGAQADLFALSEGMIGGAQGTVIVDGMPLELAPELAEVSILAVHVEQRFGNPGRTDYVGVGTQGTVFHGVRGNAEGPPQGAQFGLETSAELRGIVAFELADNIVDKHLAVVGDGAVFELTPRDQGADLGLVYEWRSAEAPADGWGSLRAAGLGYFGAVVAVGDAGRYVERVGDDDSPTWEARDLGTSTDLLAVCASSPGERVLGKGGELYVRGAALPWQRVELGTTEDLIACSESLILTSGGRVLDVHIRNDAMPTEITEIMAREGLRAIEDRREEGGGLGCVRGVGDAGLALEQCSCADAPSAFGATRDLRSADPWSARYR